MLKVITHLEACMEKMLLSFMNLLKGHKGNRSKRKTGRNPNISAKAYVMEKFRMSL